MPAPQTTHIPFGLGLSQGEGDFVKPAGKLSLATNAHLNYDGTIELRRGFQALSTSAIPSGTAAPSFRAFTRGDELCASDGRTLYTWSEAEQKWQERDSVAECNVTGRIPVVRGADAPQQEGETLYCNGVYVCAWVATGTVYAVCIDAVNGARTNEVAWTGSDGVVRLLKLGHRVYALSSIFNVNGYSQIVGRWLDTDNLSAGWTGWSAICSDASVSHLRWEACEDGEELTDHLFLVYDGVSAVASNGRLRRLDKDLLSTHAIDIPLLNSYNAWGIAADKYYGMVWVFADGSGLKGTCCASSDLSGLWALATYDAAGGIRRIAANSAPSSGYCVVAYDVTYDSLVPQEQSLRALMVLDDTSVHGNGYHRTYHLTPSSQPWCQDGRWYLAAYLPEKSWQTEHLQPSTYVLELRFGSAFDADGTQPRVACRIGQQQCGELRFKRYSRATQTAAVGEYCFAVPKVSETQGEDGAIRDEGFDVYRVRHMDQTCQLPATLGPYVALSGGVPSLYDGTRCFEIGYHYYPRVRVEASNTAGGGFAAGGYYQWCAVYRWVDGQGGRHVSAPSEPVELTFAGLDDTATITVDCLTLTNMGCFADTHPSRVQVDLYRTTMASGVPNGTFHYVASVDNNELAPTVTFTDTGTGGEYGDVAISDNATLYTDGGELDNEPMPATTHLCVHNNRLWGVHADSPYEVRYSKQILPYEGVAFSRAFVVSNAQAERYIALAAPSSSLLAFRDSQIDIVTGIGPNDLGTGGTYEEPVLLAPGVGCCNARSVVTYPGGVMFQARGGIYSVTPGGQVSWVGKPARETLEEGFPVVTGACLDTARRRAVFSAVDTDSRDDVSAGALLVYYYEADQWTRWAIKTVGGTDNAPIFSLALTASSGTPALCLLYAGGVIYRERSTCQDPDGAALTLSIRTAWLSPHGMQGYGKTWRALILGRYLSACSGVVRVYNDYRNTLASEHTYDAATVAGATSGRRVQLETAPTTQETQAIQLAIELTPTAPAYGACMRLESLAIEYAPDAGLARLPSSARK